MVVLYHYDPVGVQLGVLKYWSEKDVEEVVPLRAISDIAVQVHRTWSLYAVHHSLSSIQTRTVNPFHY
jgi:hypothetical protein